MPAVVVVVAVTLPQLPSLYVRSYVPFHRDPGLQRVPAAARQLFQSVRQNGQDGFQALANAPG